MQRNRLLIQAARERPCVDCGIDWLPARVMHLDHVRGPKVFKVCLTSNVLVRNTGQIQREIDKCDPRCPNCHGLRHFEETVRMGTATATVS